MQSVSVSGMSYTTGDLLPRVRQVSVFHIVHASLKKMGMVWHAIFGAFYNSSHNVSMMVSLREYTIGVFLVYMCL